jgi:hypothetical protein
VIRHSSIRVLVGAMIALALAAPQPAVAQQTTLATAFISAAADNMLHRPNGLPARTLFGDMDRLTAQFMAAGLRVELSDSLDRGIRTDLASASLACALKPALCSSPRRGRQARSCSARG